MDDRSQTAAMLAIALGQSMIAPVNVTYVPSRPEPGESNAHKRLREERAKHRNRARKQKKRNRK